MKYAILDIQLTTTIIASFPFRGLWEGYSEVRANVTLRPWKRMKSIKALVEVTLGHTTSGSCYDHLVDIPTHLGPIKVFIVVLNYNRKRTM